MQQMAVLQASTAMHLLHAGANMLLMQTGMLASPRPPPCLPRTAVRAACDRSGIGSPDHRLQCRPNQAAEVKPRPSKPAPPPEGVERPITSAAIVLPKSVTVVPDKANVAVRTITLAAAGPALRRSSWAG